MRRRSARRAAVLLAVAVLPIVGAEAVAPAFEAAGTRAAAASRPNVLVILTDDQRATGTFGVMPETRRLFRKGGTRFPRAFATTPVCCPSRASIFTGRYAHNHEVHTNKEAHHIDERSTIQRYMQEAGYRTGFLGKFLNGWQAERDPAFFDRWALMSPAGYKNVTFNLNGGIRKVNRYSTDFLGRRASSFIKQFEQTGDPWFVFVSVYAPHEPFTAERKYRKVRVGPWKGNPAVRERDKSDKPGYVRGKRKKLSAMQRLRADQLRTLRSVDDMVDRIYRTLTKVGAANDTLAFYLSDHGFQWGEHGLKGKNYPYVPSIRHPLLARWPGRLGAGVADRRLAANVDVVPTIMDAAGITPDPEYPVDGRSLFGPDRRERIFTEAWPENFVPTWASVLTDDTHYIEYFDSATGQITDREYYDLRFDPWELRNLLGDADPGNDPPPGEIAALSLQVQRDRACIGTVGESSCP